MLDSIDVDEGPLEVGVDVVEVVGVIFLDFDIDFEVTAVLDRLVEDEGLWEDDKAELGVEMVGIIFSGFDLDFEIMALLGRLIEDEGSWEDDEAEVDVVTTALLDRLVEEIEDADEDTAFINSTIFGANFACPADGIPVIPAVAVEASVASEVTCGAFLSEVEDADEDTASIDSSIFFGRPFGATFAVAVETFVVSEVTCGACPSEIEDADEDTASTNSTIFFRRPFGATFAGLADGLPIFTVMSVEGRRAFEVPCEARRVVVGWGDVTVWEVETAVSPDPLIGRAGMAVLECWTEAVEEGGGREGRGGEEATHELSDI